MEQDFCNLLWFLRNLSYHQFSLVSGTFIYWDFYISCRLQGKSQIVQDELVKLGEQMVNSAEGTKALALELCREFEDRFLQHITTGEVRYEGGYILMKLAIVVFSLASIFVKSL